MNGGSVLVLLGFLAVNVLVALSGVIFRPGSWYGTIDKPSWTPPNWAFPVVWTALYIAIAVAGWLVWREVGFAPAPFAAFAVQLILNAAWSACFFGLRRPDVAFADIILLWGSIAVTLMLFAPISALAALLLAPYLAWVTLAAALNWSVWRRNRKRLALV